MEVIEHVPASRGPAQGYRDPLARIDGALIAEARRADASRRWPWVFAVLAVVTGGLALLGFEDDPLALSSFLLGAMMLLCTLASAGAWARVLGRLRLEVRDGRLTARTVHVWERTVSMGAEHVLAIDVTGASAGFTAKDQVALVARLSRDRVVPLLEPLAREDAEALRELARSALGIETSKA